MTIELTTKTFWDFVSSGEFQPPQAFVPVINLDLSKYCHWEELCTNHISYMSLEERMTPELFSTIYRSFNSFLLRFSPDYFPGYQFIAGECANSDWLAIVDRHKSFHRDHIVHQPLTTYIGMRLLQNDIVLMDGQTLLQHCLSAVSGEACNYLRVSYQKMCGHDDIFQDKPLHKKLLEFMFCDAFFLASLYHDIGYPWQFINILNTNFDHVLIFNDPRHQNSIETLRRCYGNRLVFFPFQGYRQPDGTEPAMWLSEMDNFVSQALQNTHGLPGALAMLNLMDSLRVFPDLNDCPEQRFCLEWAAMVIMRHDIAKLYATIEMDNTLNVRNPHLRLSFEQDPLSFLLTFCDIIQDFGRFDGHFTNLRGDVQLNYNERCHKVCLDKPQSDILRITYFYKDLEDYYLNAADYLPKRELLYFDPVAGYLDYSAMGISKVVLTAKYEK
jgi:hypothetical protein